MDMDTSGVDVITSSDDKQMEVIKTYLRFRTYPPEYTKNQKRTVRKCLQNGQYELQGENLYYNTHVGQYNKKENRKLLVVTGKTEKMRLLWHCHTADLAAHAGINATLEKVSMAHFWHGMKDDVRRYCDSCDVCQRQTKLITMAPALKSIKVVAPWHMVGMDLVGPKNTTANGNKYILTLTDYFTKFVDFHAIPAKNAETVAGALKTFFLRWGAPQKLLSDQGREFVNKINYALAEKFKVKRMMTSAYHPQTNGLDERTNQTVQDRLGRLCNEHQNDWDDYLDEVAFSMRSQKQKSTKFTPFFLMFHREVRMPHHMEMSPDIEINLTKMEGQHEEVDAYVNGIGKTIEDVNQKVLKNVEEAQKKQKENYSRRKGKGVKVFNLKVGDLVLRRNIRNHSRIGGKMEPRWLGPFTIAAIDGSQRVLLQPIGKMKPLQVWCPYDRLKPYIKRKDDATAFDPSSQALQEEMLGPITAPFFAEAPDTEGKSAHTTTTPIPILWQKQSGLGKQKQYEAASNDLPPCKTSRCEEVMITGRTPAPKRSPEALPVTRQSQPLQTWSQIECALQTIQSGAWLADDAIDHAQGLLLNKFPEMPGLQNRMLFGPLHAPRVAAPAGGWVQILNLNDNHWLCASTVGCDPGVVNLFDSLFIGATAPRLLSELARMLHTEEPEMVINWQACTKQIGGADCGVYAVAFATALCHGYNPGSYNFPQEHLRSHLVKCFKEGNMTMFPSTFSGKPACKSIMKVSLFCLCRMPCDNLAFNHCLLCKDKFHTQCVTKPHFLCKKCSRKFL